MSDDGTMASTPRTDGHLPAAPSIALRPAELVEARGERRISVCIPARDEAATVGDVVATLVGGLTAAGGGVPLLHEVLVVDDGSSDGTGDVARRAGARVVGPAPSDGTPERQGFGGKGQAMAAALEESEGDLLVYLDADVTNFSPHFVTGLLGPLLTEESTTLVKGFYERPLHGAPGGGGRVPELVARPAIDLLFPELSGIHQPLAGETAAPRWVLEKCGLADGYAVELALLIDVATRFGVETIAQVDLGVRVHRNRPLSELRPQAVDVLRAALDRAGVTPPPPH